MFPCSSAFHGVREGRVAPRAGVSILRNVRIAAGAIGLCALMLGTAAGQEGTFDEGESFGPDEPLFEPREVGTVRTWLNIVDDDRIPIIEKPVLEGARRAVIPPRTSRTGLIPRITLTTEYEDNVFFTADDRDDDVVLVASPGLSYANSGRRWNIFVDYALESALYLNTPELNSFVDAQSGILIGTFAASPRTNITVFDGLRETRDPTEQLVPTAVRDADRVLTNLAFASVTHAVTRRIDATARYGNLLQIVDQEDGVDITVHEAVGTVEWDATRRDRLGLSYQFRSFVFTGATGQTAQSASVEYQRDFGERLVTRGSIGFITTGGRSSKSYVRGSAALEASFKSVILGLEFNRDVTATVGIADILLENNAKATMLARLGRGWQTSSEFSFSNLNSTQTKDFSVNALEWQAAVSYALADNVWARMRYALIHEAPRDQANITANRVMLSIVGSL